MLRTVKIKNFIHFEDEHTLTFDRGSNFLIGGNHTGKTSLYEAIRRCMSVSKSKGISGTHDADKSAYVTCVFGVDGNEIKSSMIRLPTKKTNGEDPCFLKTFELTREAHVFADLVKKNKERQLVCQKLPEQVLHDIKPTILGDDLHFYEGVLTKLEGHRRKLRPFFKTDFLGKYTATECEIKLMDSVDQHIVIIYPFRSISPFESTVTKTKPKEHRQQIARTVSGRADILKWYLQNKDKVDKTEQENEERYFNIITDKSGFQFNIDARGIISVENMQMRKRKLDSAPLLLKIPEGIYEAKRLAVLLAVRKFTTVCLDDAERGMHPQMIERFRDHVLMEIKDKTILLITHHPSFLARWNIPRLLLFQRVKVEDNEKFRIKSLKTPFSRDGGATCAQGTTAVDIGEKTFQLMAEHSFSSLFFARRILFVEGKSDELLITEFIKVLIKDKRILRKFLIGESTEDVDALAFFISGFHIISMNGSTNAYKFRNLCLTLDLQHCMILDYDVMFNNLGKKYTGKTDIETFCSKLQLSFNPTECKKIPGNVGKLESENIFMWTPEDIQKKNTGKIENAVLALIPEDSDFLKCRLINRKKKLLLDSNVEYKHINDIAGKCVELSQGNESSDFHRLVIFFFMMSQKK